MDQSSGSTTSSVARFSDAIEHQLSLLRFCESPRGAFWEQTLRRTAATDAPGAKPEWMDLQFASTLMSLRYGDPYYWPASFCRLVAASAPAMPDWVLTRDAIPGQYGFFSFEEPLHLPDVAGDGEPWASAVTAVAWAEFYQLSDDGGPTLRRLPPGDQPHKKFLVFTIHADMQGINGRFGVPVTLVPWREGESTADVIAAGLRVHPKNVERWSLKVRYIAATLAFLNQRVLVTDTRPAKRETQRRAGKRLEIEPLVRVIRLRRPTQSPHNRDSRGDDHEWTCQWFVRGHWRQQWYPKLGRHQPKWIAPYIKGPDDAPLKAPRANVFAVVR